MKKMMTLFTVFFIIISCLNDADAQQKKKVHEWWNDQNIGKPLNSPNAKKTPTHPGKGK